jgi:hypothetical protein
MHRSYYRSRASLQVQQDGSEDIAALQIDAKIVRLGAGRSRVAPDAAADYQLVFYLTLGELVRATLPSSAKRVRRHFVKHFATDLRRVMPRIRASFLAKEYNPDRRRCRAVSWAVSNSI